MDFIEQASRGRYKKPIHFAKVAEVLTLAEQLTNARDVIAAPVQHGKTTIIEFVIAWILLRHPDRPIIYLTYAQRKAEKHSRRIRAIYSQCGGQLASDFNTIQEWKTTDGGGLLATSRDGEITGNPAVHIFFDDPYKNREEADNAEILDRLEELFSSEVVTRLAPNGSITIIASRWNEDDLSGVKIREGYRNTHLRAIETVVVETRLVGHEDDGTPVYEHVTEERALCPWGPDPRYPRDLEFLHSIRDGKDVTEHDWFSLYQGEPRPRGAGLFGEASYFDELPPIRRWIIGADFAYSTAGDRIALVAMGLGFDDLLYVDDVWIGRTGVIEAIPDVRAFLAPYPGAQIAMYCSGPELGTIKALRRLERSAGGPIVVQPLPARLNKYLRAGRTARRWNGPTKEFPDQKPGILVRRGAAWAAEFVRRVKGFTGQEGGRDDEVDAMVSGHDIAFIGETFRPFGGRFTAGKRVM